MCHHITETKMNVAQGNCWNCFHNKG